MVLPSPIFQTTAWGVAVALAATPSTVAVTVLGCHASGLTHSQLATRTSCSAPAGGAISITGDDNLSVLAACCATVTGEGCSAAAGGAGVPFAGGPETTQTGGPFAWEPPGPVHWSIAQ